MNAMPLRALVETEQWKRLMILNIYYSCYYSKDSEYIYKCGQVVDLQQFPDIFPAILKYNIWSAADSTTFITQNMVEHFIRPHLFFSRSIPSIYAFLRNQTKACLHFNVSL